jgi:hypothetical protein
MACKVVKLPNGMTALVKMAPQRKKFCECGRPCTKLCDYVMSHQSRRGVTERTCDKPMCDRCAVHVGPETDYCVPHAEIMRQRESGEPK